MVRSLAFAAVLAVTTLATGASAQNARPDLADLAAGTYHGDVISDSRGSSRSNVTMIVTKTAPNTVLVATTYSRLPNVTTRLERVMSTVQGTGRPTGPLDVFLLDTSKTPLTLDLTIDGASWSGEKAP